MIDILYGFIRYDFFKIIKSSIKKQFKLNLETLLKIRDTLNDSLNDKKCGIDTIQGQFSAKIYKDFLPYMPLNYSIAKKIIDHLNLEKTDVFVDLGCGKGRLFV